MDHVYDLNKVNIYDRASQVCKICISQLFLFTIDSSYGTITMKNQCQ